MAFVGLTSADKVHRAASDTTSVGFVAPVRIQRNILAARERDALHLLSRALPPWIKPDHLTMLGLVGMVVACLGYVGSNWRPAFLFAASFGLLLNWFGDSLDGTLARHRGIERPRYGYFLDHSVDACGNFLLLFGLGMSPYVEMDVALFALTGYLLLSIYSFLTCHVCGTFHLTFLGCGPSEMRLALIALNLIMYFQGAFQVSLFGHVVSIYSLLVGGFGTMFLVIFVARAAMQARDLRAQDREGQAGPKRRATDVT